MRKRPMTHNSSDKQHTELHDQARPRLSPARGLARCAKITPTRSLPNGHVLHKPQSKDGMPSLAWKTRGDYGPPVSAEPVESREPPAPDVPSAVVDARKPWKQKCGDNEHRRLGQLAEMRALGRRFHDAPPKWQAKCGGGGQVAGAWGAAMRVGSGGYNDTTVPRAPATPSVSGDPTVSGGPTAKQPIPWRAHPPWRFKALRRPCGRRRPPTHSWAPGASLAPPIAWASVIDHMSFKGPEASGDDPLESGDRMDGRRRHTSSGDPTPCARRPHGLRRPHVLRRPLR